MQSPTSANTSAVRFNSSPQRMAMRAELPYWYVAQSGPAGTYIAQGATGTFSITLQAGNNFMVYALAATIVDSTGLPVLPQNSTAYVQVNDTGTGANWFSQSAGLSSLFGSAALPFILPVVMVVAQTATLSFSVTNVKDGAAAAGANYSLTLIGTKLKNTGGGIVGSQQLG